MRSGAILATIVVGAGMAGAARAQTNVAAGIHGSSEHWTLAGSPYRLGGTVYFDLGTTLTIDAGVVVASLPANPPTVPVGTLVIVKGADIFINGTQANPVIFTSTNDVATWTGTTGSGATQIPGNPKTGNWRVANAEWGGLVIMGDAYISENAAGLGNTAVPSATNEADMEGLTTGPSTDRYGGGNDNDDSGSISYVSLRYGGAIIGPGVELNALSLGGIGRNTEIHHVDIMNNVDDGIEIWGGTVNVKYANIWNIGDDSIDIDQGWRGKAQFGLIVQGYSSVAAQGSGVGDNCFETDGAENSDWQPVTTTSIYNCTVIGQPIDGDRATAWRDNARVQYRNCIFMDIGEELVGFDNLDGNGAQGYGFNTTLSWANTWSTNFNAVPAHANDFTTGSYAVNYPAQTSGKLAEITDSVFFNNNYATGLGAYGEATTVGAYPGNGTNNNVDSGNLPANRPIVAIKRGPNVIVSGKTMQPVVGLDPHPKNAAAVSVAMAPNDGFYTPAPYRGAFAPGAESWLCQWTASYAFGYTSDCGPGSAFCEPGQNGIIACPCSNPPVAPGLGCNNFGTGPAFSGTLSAVGVASLSGDTVVQNLTGANNGGVCVFWTGKGPLSATGVAHAAGVRCVTQALKRLYSKTVVAGNATAPTGADQSVSARTATLYGAPIVAGESRYYFNIYRDPQAAGPCGNTTSTVNLTNGYAIAWGP